jgi:hypothetical protein
MLKKFTEGLVFGGGFAISWMALWYIAAYLITPMFSPQIEEAVNKRLSETGANIQPSNRPSSESFREPAIPFHELALEEKIKKSSVIALVEFEASPDGKMKAIIKEFLKKESGVAINYKLGDEYPNSSYYPREENNSGRKDLSKYGHGAVIFFTGSPASMKFSTSYLGDRIGGLGDIPVELFRKKCKEPNA